MNYKGYCINNFDGKPDNRYREIVDNGTFLRNDGNWDYILFDGNVYSIALANSGCVCTWFGNLDYFKRLR